MESNKHYKLVYFPMRGRAEMIRLIFAYAKVEYEDFRMPYEDFLKIKPELPFGQFPILEVNGKVLAQSLAIGRYLAREFGLTGKTNLEAAICDMVMDCFQDLMRGVSKYLVFRKDEKEKKKRMFDRFFNQLLPPFLKNLEKVVKRTEGKYLIGNSITWADIQMGYLLGEFQKFSPTTLDNYPILKELVEDVNNQPAIREWYEKRPPPGEFDRLFELDVFYEGDFVYEEPKH